MFLVVPVIRKHRPVLKTTEPVFSCKVLLENAADRLFSSMYSLIDLHRNELKVSNWSACQ